MTEKSSAMHVDAALVRKLAELLDETQLTEIEVQDGERKIRVQRSSTVAAVHTPAQITVPSTASAAVDAPAAPPETGHSIKSPMVGTVFLAAEPGAKPFAAVGDTVSEGQTLVIIEAMKVMNSITAPHAGKVTKVCVDNGQPVEFDQLLLIIA